MLSFVDDVDHCQPLAPGGPDSMPHWRTAPLIEMEVKVLSDTRRVFEAA